MEREVAKIEDAAQITMSTDTATLCELKDIMCPNEHYWKCGENIQYLQLFFIKGNKEERGIEELRCKTCAMRA